MLLRKNLEDETGTEVKRRADRHDRDCFGPHPPLGAIIHIQAAKSSGGIAAFLANPLEKRMI